MNLPRRRKKLAYEFKNGVWQAKLNENHVVDEIIERLYYQARISVYRVRERIPNKETWGKRWQQLSTPGIPDLIGWIPSMPQQNVSRENGSRQPLRLSEAVPLFIECKRPGKNVHRPAQERFITEAQAAGCCAFFAESWSDVVRELAKFGVALSA